MILMKYLNQNDVGNIYLIIHKDLKKKIFVEYQGFESNIFISHRFRYKLNFKDIYQFYQIYTFFDEKYFVQKINLPFDIVCYINIFL